MVIHTTVGNGAYKEYTYVPAGSYDSYGVPADDPISTRFNVFQTKVVMLSSTEFAPSIKDYRVYALDS
jgi:hypothetical protein